MRIPRSTLARWLLAVPLAGFGLAAMRRNDPRWSSAFEALTIALLAIAALGTVLARGRGRVAWAAFALLGGSYLGFATWSGHAPMLPTTRLLEWLGPRLVYLGRKVAALPRADFDHAFSAWAEAHPGAVTPAIIGSSVSGEDIHITWFDSDLGPFLRAGQCLFALLLGWLGSAIARALAPAGAARARADRGGSPVRRTG